MAQKRPAVTPLYSLNPGAGYPFYPLTTGFATGLPFLVDESEGPRCPLAWIDAAEPEGDAGGALATGGDPAT